LQFFQTVFAQHELASGGPNFLTRLYDCDDETSQSGSQRITGPTVRQAEKVDLNKIVFPQPTKKNGKAIVFGYDRPFQVPKEEAGTNPWTPLNGPQQGIGDPH
jgi:hypothetical protein